jgi:hypothetical protein
MYQSALGMGLSPDQFWDMTLAEFAWYRDGYIWRQARDWDHTASLMALLANVNSGKGKTFSPSDFHPIDKKNKGVQSRKEAEDLLKKMSSF